MKLFQIVLFSFVGFFNQQVFAQNLAQTEKLVATCKVWGYLKYYHPQVAKGKFDIDQQLFDVLPKVNSAQNKEEFSGLLVSWIESFGNIKSKTKSTDSDYFDKNFDLSWIENEKYFSDKLTCLLRLIEENRYQGRQYYVKANETAGFATMTNEEPFKNSGWEKEEIRLLSLFRFWNFSEYFFPYKYLTDKDWDVVLEDAIPEFLHAASETDYHLAMLELVASVDDSHGSFMTKNLFNHFGDKFAPFKTKFIEGTVVVTGYYDEELSLKNDIQYGDVIAKINGIPVMDYFEKYQMYIMGSNLAVQQDNAHGFLFNGTSESLTVELLRKDSILSKTVTRYLWNDLNRTGKKKEEKFKLYENNIGYLKIGNITQEEFQEVYNEVAESKTLIIDMRFGLNNTSQLLANVITSKESMFTSLVLPCLDYPGRYRWVKGNLEQGNNVPRYKGKVIILVNEATQSNAEYTAMWLQTGENVITLGSQTSGADGNVTQFEMVGGYPVRYSGVGVFYPDGTQTQRIGIKIDVTVQQTLNGLLEHRDDQLEKALELANDSK